MAQRRDPHRARFSRGAVEGPGSPSRAFRVTGVECFSAAFVGANPSGKPSKSLAKVISRAPGSTASSTPGMTTSTTTFEVTLNSGRPHQIRIHLASIAHPLVGDPLYGVTGQPLENLPGLPGDGGYFLHAQFLNFHHPITGEQIELEAALPAGFSGQQ